MQRSEGKNKKKTKDVKLFLTFLSHEGQVVKMQTLSVPGGEIDVGWAATGRGEHHNDGFLTSMVRAGKVHWTTQTKGSMSGSCQEWKQTRVEERDINKRASLHVNEMCQNSFPRFFFSLRSKEEKNKENDAFNQSLHL